MQNQCTECKKQFEVSEKEAKWKNKCASCFKKKPNNERNIIRQTCIKAASQLGGTPEEVIRSAEKFEGWINR